MPAKWQRWMPFHIDKFRGSPSVQAMDPGGRAGYLYLLASAWQSDDCTLSSDPLDLAEAAGLNDEQWRLYGPRILRKFEVLPNGRLQNAFLLAEWTEAKRVFEARKKGAKKTNDKIHPHDDRTLSDGKDDGQRKGNETTLSDGLCDAHRDADRNAERPKIERRADTYTYTETETEKLNTPSNARATDDDDFPEGLTAQQYAAGILERNGIPQNFPMITATAASIDAIATIIKKPRHRAAAALEQRVIAALQRGETVNRYWMDDSKWRNQGAANGQNNQGQSGNSARIARSDAALAEALAARRRLRAAGDDSPTTATPVLPPGPRRLDGGFSDGLRSVGGEVLPAVGHRRTARG